MADSPFTQPAGTDARSPEKKKDDRRQAIIVVTSVIGVILAYLIWRSRNASSTSSTTAVTNPALTSTGTVAGGTAADAYNGLASYLQNIGAEVQQLQNTVATQQNSTSTTPLGENLNTGTLSPPPPPTPANTTQVANGTAGWAYQAGNTNVIENTATDAIYQVQPTGLYYLGGPQYAALGSPKPSSTWSDPTVKPGANIAF